MSKKIEREIKDLLSRSSVANEALNGLEMHEMMSASHLFTPEDRRLVRLIREEIAYGNEPDWHNYPAGTRRYDLFIKKIGI